MELAFLLEFKTFSKIFQGPDFTTYSGSDDPSPVETEGGKEGIAFRDDLGLDP
jgi:hypothetical protein